MSQEFEKKVLEKLDNFEGRFDRIEKTLEEHTGILNGHTEEFKKVNKILDGHTKILNNHTEQLKIVRKDIYKINNNLIKTAQKMEEIEYVVEYNTQTIKKFKEDSSKKLM